MESGSSSSSGRICKYQVFLSFRGADTRNFVDNLYAHLTQKGIIVFKDPVELQIVKDISLHILQAIKDSLISIVVFSKDYADSTWCLEETATVAECRDKGQAILPVFYDVGPSEVRKQGGVYEKAFALHTQRFKEFPERVVRWRSAMTSLADLAGYSVQQKPEFEVIEKIVQHVITILGLSLKKLSWFNENLVGMQSRIEALKDLLKLSLDNDDIRVLGIWGMVGIGKTTCAAALYDTISCQFDACCFIQDIRQIYSSSGAIAVQKMILHDTQGEKNLESYSPFEIAKILRNWLSTKKFLIVLDNIDELQQLEKLAINPTLLGAGSRIIITTRDEHILKVYGVDNVYKVPLLNQDEARHLLIRNAFKGDDSNFRMIYEILDHAQGLPLAIKICGSVLYDGGDTSTWRATVDNKIMDVLQTSFEKLKPTEREIFLHIACFFNGKKEHVVKQILDSCGLHPTIGIPVLIEKSHVTIIKQDIQMHPLLQELGKKVVKEESPSKPHLWSRLWRYKDFHYVMTTNTGAVHIKALVLDERESVSSRSPLRAEEFSKMKELGILILNDNNFVGNLSFLSNKIRYLSWRGYPFNSLPSSFQSSRLGELDMSRSNIKQLWEDIKHFPYLRRIDLSYSKELETTPDFTGIPNLERLVLTGCTKLKQLHSSIELLGKLALLTLRDCCSLVSLPDLGTKSNLSCLKTLDLSGCTELERTPDFTRIPNIERLKLEECTKLKHVHPSIGLVKKLYSLSLRSCCNLATLPDLGTKSNSSSSLEVLDLTGCTELEKTPDFSGIPNLRILQLAGCTKLKLVHPSIGLLRKLTFLSLRNCIELVTLLDQGTESDLSSLRYLYLTGCSKLENTPNFTGFSNLQLLDLQGCTSLSKLDESIGNLSKLKVLKMRDCTNLVSISDSINNIIDSLESVHLPGCSKLQNLSPETENKVSNFHHQETWQKAMPLPSSPHDYRGQESSGTSRSGVNDDMESIKMEVLESPITFNNKSLLPHEERSIDYSELTFETRVGIGPSSTAGAPSVSAPQAEGSSPAQPLSRYKSQKRRDWNTFLRYLQRHKPPLTLRQCSVAHVIEFLKYMDQWGKTKVHLIGCLFFGLPNPPAPCFCPLRQAWESLDALSMRLRAAYEENGGRPESNPFGARGVRIYLREVREAQVKARGIPETEKKSRKRPTVTNTMLSTNKVSRFHLDVRDKRYSLYTPARNQETWQKAISLPSSPHDYRSRASESSGTSGCGVNDKGNLVESNRESTSSTDTIAEKLTSDSSAVVSVPDRRTEPSAVVPVSHKTRRPFSVSEVDALVLAVEELGTARWRDIKLRHFENANHITYVDLKDKWKTLVHTARISPQQRRGEQLPQELLDRVLAAHAYWSYTSMASIKLEP